MPTTSQLRTRPVRLLRRLRGRTDGGFATLELVILTPVLLAFVLLIVGFGRVVHGRALVGQAAAAAARAASLAATPGQAQTAARQEATADLTGAGISCTSMSTAVDTSQFHPGGQVTVTITCVANMTGLTVLFPPAKTLSATSVSPLDSFRQYGTRS